MQRHYNSITDSPQRFNLTGHFVIFILEIVSSWMYVSFLCYESAGLDRPSAFFLAALASVLTSTLCYGNHFFRVVLVVFFSVSWGYLALALTDLMPGSSINRWVAFGIVSLLLLLAHRPILRKKPPTSAQTRSSAHLF